MQKNAVRLIVQPVQPPVQPPIRRRRALYRYNPEDEVALLRKKVEEERGKRRILEQDLYKLKLERTEMCHRMSKLENSKLTSSVPASLMPILVDAMAKGLDPTKIRPEANTNKAPAAQQTQPTNSTVIRAAAATAPSVVRAAAPASRPRLSTPTTVPRPPAARGPGRPSTVRPSVPSQPVLAQPQTTTVPSGPQQYIIQSREADGKTITFLVPITPGQVVAGAADNVVSVVNMTNQSITQPQSVVDLTQDDADSPPTTAVGENRAGQAVDQASAVQKAPPIVESPASPLPEESDFVDMDS